MTKNIPDQFVLSPAEFDGMHLHTLIDGVFGIDGRRITATVSALRRALKAERAYHSNNSGENAREHTEAIKAVKEWI